MEESLLFFLFRKFLRYILHITIGFMIISSVFWGLITFNFSNGIDLFMKESEIITKPISASVEWISTKWTERRMKKFENIQIILPYQD